MLKTLIGSAAGNMTRTGTAGSGDPRVVARSMGRRLLTALVLAALALSLLVVALAAGPAYAVPTVTVGPNVNTMTRLGNEAEVTIAVNPTNPQQIFVASNPGTTASNSADGGMTWNQFRIGTGPAPAGDGFPNSCCDNVAVWDNFGNLFLSYLTFGPDGIPSGRPGDTDGNTIELLISTTGGGAGSFTLLQQIDTGANIDQPALALGPGNVAGSGSLWVTWNDGTIRARGALVTGLGAANIGAFTAEQAVPGASGQFGDIAVGPNGEVVVTYQTNTAIFVNTDADGLGAGGFAAQVNVTATNVVTFDFIPPQSGRSIDAEANLAYDRSGGANNGRLYLAYTDEQPDESNDTDILVRFSDDNGAIWSGATQVNDDAGTNSQFLPVPVVDQTTGIVAVTWHDARNDDGTGPHAADTNGIANDDAQYWGSASDDGGATWAPNFQISAGTSNAALAGSGIDYGDYTSADFNNRILYPAWADNSNSTGDNPNGALSRFDIYTARIVIGNDPPVADANGPYTTDEGTNVTLDGSGSSDPEGDALTFEWDLDDDTIFGETGAAAAAGNETGAAPTFTAVGDDGVFPVCLRVTDPFGASDINCTTVTVNNVDPTADIDLSGSILINGVPTFLAHAGDPLDFSGRSTDPGSDDLTVRWDWGDGSPVESTTYLVNPPNPDPFPSPSIQPRDVTDLKTHTFAGACLYEVSLWAEDDDGGTSTVDTVNVIIVGNADEVRSAGYWKNQFRSHLTGHGHSDFDQPDLECYLEIVGYMSLVFDEVRDASTFASAHDVLSVKKTAEMSELLDRQLLAAWLNFANGSIEYDELVDTDGDNVPDTAFADALAAAEAVRLNPAATHAELEEQKDILERINLTDS